MEDYQLDSLIQYIIPLSVGWYAYILYFQVGVMDGYGFFAGIGQQYQLGVIDAPVSSGKSKSYFIEGDLGFGPAFGGRIQANSPIGSGISGAIGGKLGVGAGAFLGGGQQGSYTLASDTLFCGE